MKTQSPLQLLTIVAIASCASSVHAAIHLPSRVGDHMVLQREHPIVLTGTAVPGERIRASLSLEGNASSDVPSMSASVATTTADPAGRFALTLPPRHAGGPFVLVVEGSSRLSFSDVWIGEVWLAAGQSNMEMALHAAAGAELATASGCSSLHWFNVAHASSLTPQNDVQGTWANCNARTAGGISAVGYYFGRELARALGVPIGLIQSTWGGSPGEAWTSRPVLLADPTLAQQVAELDRAVVDPAVKAAHQRKLRDWEAATFVQDSGNRGEALGFARPEAKLDGWQSMLLPQLWEKVGLAIDGAVWFRRDITLPPSLMGKDLTVSLGALDDFDVAYWNGERVGTTGSETPQFWSVQRRYNVPSRLLRPGRNVIAVRIFDRGGEGGFAGPPEELWVKSAANTSEKLALAGQWFFRIERAAAPVNVDWGSRPRLWGPDEPSSPTVLWNAMVAPLSGTPLAGVIWYQGESNVGRTSEYRTLFPALIRAWRKAWNQSALPFLFVQLPNYVGSTPERSSQLGNSPWAELREAQAVALRQPHTAMAVTLDIGESNNIHPRNKQEVGRRLALQALRTVYGRNVIADGPSYRSFVRQAQALRVRFGSIAGGLSTSDGALPKGFLIAGGDRVWHTAVAHIEGSEVVVSSPSVLEPVAVRYGWANDPAATLLNAAELPAAPFRTDSW